MVLQIIVWYKFFVRRIDGLTKTSKLRSIWRDNERHGLLNSETGASQEVETPNTKHVVWGVGCGVWGVGCGVWGVGCVAWCLVFGVWCSGFWGMRGVRPLGNPHIFKRGLNHPEAIRPRTLR